MKTTTNAERFQAAQASVRDGESRGLSETTMRKRWKAYFAAEDAIKGSAVWA